MNEHIKTDISIVISEIEETEWIERQEQKLSKNSQLNGYKCQAYWTNIHMNMFRIP